MNSFIRLSILAFVLLAADYAYSSQLQPVIIRLQFVTSTQQADWVVNSDFTTFPFIAGSRGNTHKSWDGFIRGFVADYFVDNENGLHRPVSRLLQSIAKGETVYERFGETAIREIGLESDFLESTVESTGDYLVTVTIKADVEDREMFECFINNEYNAYHSERHGDGHILYAWHNDVDGYPAVLPTLTGLPADPALLQCVPQGRRERFLAVINKAIESEDVKDPETLFVGRLPGLAINYSLMRLLREIASTRNNIPVTEMWIELEGWIQDAIEFRISTLDGELLRLPAERVSSLARFLRLPGRITSEEKRMAMLSLYKELMDGVRAEWRDMVSHVATRSDLDDLIRTISGSLEEQADLRFLRVREIASAPIRKIARKITDREIARVHKAVLVEQQVAHNYTIYSHTTGTSGAGAPAEMSRQELLAFYAPNIVQAQQVNQLRYNPAIDQIGRLKMVGHRCSDICVFVDVSSPAVYTHTRNVSFGDTKYLQLTYEFWYPEHPEMFEGDKEAGLLDGRFVTITLDENHTPVIYETAMNCGCFYEVYLTDNIDKQVLADLSGATMPSSYNGKPVSGVLSAGSKINIEMNAGFHTVTRISNVTGEEGIAENVSVRPYRLDTIKRLELLPLGNGYASIYHSNGLIRTGGRPESYLMWMSYPENYYAGWNRHHSQRRYGLNPDKDGFHNPFWIQSIMPEADTSDLITAQRDAPTRRLESDL